MKSININTIKKSAGRDIISEASKIYGRDDIVGITLMHKDDQVLYFDRSMDIKIINPNLVPLQIRDEKNLDLSSLLEFIKSRSISIKRKYYKDIMNHLRIQQESSEYAIIIKTQALSLQDHYWVKLPSNKEQTWDEVNLFTNRFSEVISYIAFTGGNPTIQNELKTPEVATGGIYPKCWRRIENSIYLLKSSLVNGVEAEAEVFSSRVGTFLSDNILNYDFEIYEGRRTSRCKLFTSLEEEEVSATTLSKYLIRNGYDLNRFTLSNFRDYYYNILLIDAVVNNSDRHNSNYSFLINGSGELRPAPIFDLNNTMDEEDKKSLLDSKNRNNLDVLRDLARREEIKNKLINLSKAIDDGRLDNLNLDLIKHDRKLYNRFKEILKNRLDLTLNGKDELSWA